MCTSPTLNHTKNEQCRIDLHCVDLWAHPLKCFVWRTIARVNVRHVLGLQKMCQTYTHPLPFTPKWTAQTQSSHNRKNAKWARKRKSKLGGQTWRTCSKLHQFYADVQNWWRGQTWRTCSKPTLCGSKFATKLMTIHIGTMWKLCGKQTFCN